MPPPLQRRRGEGRRGPSCDPSAPPACCQLRLLPLRWTMVLGAGLSLAGGVLALAPLA